MKTFLLFFLLPFFIFEFACCDVTKDSKKTIVTTKAEKVIVPTKSTPIKTVEPSKPVPTKTEEVKPETTAKKINETTLAASKLPKGAKQYLPLLSEILWKEWPNLSNKTTLAAQVEQETCISLTHSRCWNPKAELKTSREYGFGFGQITTSYKQDGSTSVDNFSAIKKLDKRLSGWEWDNRYDPNTQMLALVVYDKYIYNRIPKAFSEQDQLAFTFASYNGGLGGLLKDRRICQSTKGCDPNKWFDNVEKNSWRAKTKVGGYGKSFFEINREYVRNILFVRLAKYNPFI
jgi:hypothetical protein